MATTPYTVAQCDEILEGLRLAALELAVGKPFVSYYMDATGEQVRIDAVSVHKQIQFWAVQKDRATRAGSVKNRGAIALTRRAPR